MDINNILEPREAINRLQNLGVTQKQISEYCNCGQSTISEIRNGDIKSPSHSIGIALNRLFFEKQQPATATI